MALEYIKPAGKTQADIDAEKAAKIEAQERREAEAALRDTQDAVLAAVEDWLESQGLIDAALLGKRREARSTLQSLVEEGEGNG